MSDHDVPPKPPTSGGEVESGKPETLEAGPTAPGVTSAVVSGPTVETSPGGSGKTTPPTQSWADQVENEAMETEANVSTSNPFALLCEDLGPLKISSPAPGGNKSPVGAVLAANTEVRTKTPATTASNVTQEVVPGDKAAPAAQSAVSSSGAPGETAVEDVAPANTSAAGSTGSQGKKNKHPRKKKAKAAPVPGEAPAPSTSIPSVDDLLPIGLTSDQQTPKASSSSSTPGEKYFIAGEDRKKVGSMYRERWAGVPQGYRFNPPICGNPELLKTEARRKYHAYNSWIRSPDGMLNCPHCESPYKRVDGLVRHVHSCHFPFVVELVCPLCPNRPAWRRKEDFNRHRNTQHTGKTLDPVPGAVYNPKYFPPLPSKNSPFLFHEEVLKDVELMGTKGKLPPVNTTRMSMESMKTKVPGPKASVKGAAALKRPAPSSTTTGESAPDQPAASTEGAAPPTKRNKRRRKKQAASSAQGPPPVPGAEGGPPGPPVTSPEVAKGQEGAVPPVVSATKSTTSSDPPAAPQQPKIPPATPGSSGSKAVGASTGAIPKRKPDDLNASFSLVLTARHKLATAMQRRGGTLPMKKKKVKGGKTAPARKPQPLTLGNYAQVTKSAPPVKSAPSTSSSTVMGPPSVKNPQTGSCPGKTESGKVKELPFLQTFGDWHDTVSELHRAVQQPPGNWTLHQLQGANRAAAARRDQFDKANLEWERIKSANYAVEAQLAQTTGHLLSLREAKTQISKLETQLAASEKEIARLKAQLAAPKTTEATAPQSVNPSTSGAPAPWSSVDPDVDLQQFPSLQVRLAGEAAQMANLQAVSYEFWTLATRALAHLPVTYRAREFQQFASSVGPLDWYTALRAAPQVDPVWDLRTVFEAQIASTGVRPLQIASASGSGSSSRRAPTLQMPPPQGASTAVRRPPSPILNQDRPTFPEIDPAGRSTPSMEVSFSGDPVDLPGKK